jgi:glutaredoxin
MLLVMANACADAVFRWTDESGKVFYGDVPAAGTVQVEKKSFADRPAPAEGMPYETRRAMENFPVVLYVSGNCADLCNDARELLNKRGIPYTEKTLTTKQEIDAFKTGPGGGIVPTITVGKSWTKGYQADMWNKELDLAGYPKTSTYRAPSVSPGQPVNESETPPASAVEESTVTTPNDEAPAAEKSDTEQ